MDHNRESTFRQPRSVFFNIQLYSTYLFLASLIIPVLESLKGDLFFYLNIILTSYLFTMYVANRRFWVHMRQQYSCWLTNCMYVCQTNFCVAALSLFLQFYILYKYLFVSEKSYKTIENMQAQLGEPFPTHKHYI